MGEGFPSCYFETRLRFPIAQHLGARHAGGLQAEGSSDRADQQGFADAGQLMHSSTQRSQEVGRLAEEGQ